MLYVLALLPIAILILVSLLRGVKEAVLAGWVVTTVLFFYWGASVNQYWGTLAVSLVTTLNILMIVFGATFLYTIMERNGLIKEISHSLDDLHPSKEIKFFLLAIGLTAFFEGVAGFGTPGAIVPLLLMSMGFNAVLSVSVILLFDGLFALFGAVGTPLITGLQLPLHLTTADTKTIGLLSAVAGVAVMAVLILFIFRQFSQLGQPLPDKPQLYLLFSFFAVPFCLLAWLVPELATVLAALVMLALSVIYLKGYRKKLNFRPWIPYGVLAFLLLLPKLFNPLHRWIGWDITFTDMFSSDIDVSFKPMQSPLIPFLVVGLGVLLFTKTKFLYLKNTLTKTLAVLLVLFPSIAVAQLMIYSGVRQPSMVNYISELLAQMGIFYPFFSPFIGITGAFITGSTTISNVVFGPSQLATGQSLDIPAVIVLSLQLTGAALGNAVCLFNIIAAAAIANLQNHKAVLVQNLAPTLLGGFLLGLLGWLATFFL